jgi:hypothetical protein
MARTVFWWRRDLRDRMDAARRVELGEAVGMEICPSPGSTWNQIYEGIDGLLFERME